MSALSPVLGAIRKSTGLSAAGVGLLTTLPLICFGLLAPVAPRLVRRRGTGGVLLGCLVVLFAGILVRSTDYAGLFAGTLMIGIAVAIANVLMPGIVKRDFPGHVGLMTGLYTALLSAGAALAAATTAPLALSVVTGASRPVPGRFRSSWRSRSSCPSGPTPTRRPRSWLSANRRGCCGQALSHGP